MSTTDQLSAGGRRAFTVRARAANRGQAGAVQVALQLREELAAAQWAAELVQGLDPEAFCAAIVGKPARLVSSPGFVVQLSQVLEQMFGRTRGRAATAAVLVRLQAS